MVAVDQLVAECDKCDDGEDLAGETRRTLGQAGEPVQELVGAFADAGLLDEIHLGVQPVTLGAGAPLLPRRLTSSDLTLQSVDRQGQIINLVYTVTRHG